MSGNKYLRPEELEAWLAAVCETLGLDDASVDIATVLDVARDVAHDVARPAAPLSTFLLGLAVGQAGATPEALAECARQLTARAAAWAADAEDGAAD